MFRRAAHMSQSALGERLGVTYQQIQKYENGSDRISASRLYAVAQILDVPLADFFEVPDEALSGEERGLKAALRMPEFLQIGALFPDIANPAMRRSVVDLVQTLAEAGGAHAGTGEDRSPGRKPRG